MTITNGYCTLAEFKAAVHIADTNDDATLEAVITAASRSIDDHCGRRFYSDAAVSARVYSPISGSLVHVDDFSTTTGLIVATDESLLGSFGTTWTTTDYQLEPLNGVRNGESGWPYDVVRAVGNYRFPGADRQAVVRVTAKWGWAAVPPDVNIATVMQAILTWKSFDAPLGTAGFGDMGVVRLRQDLHPTAAKLVHRFKKTAKKVA